MTERPLLGKVAIVTGAGSPLGMGYAMTLGLVRAGARVAMIDLNYDCRDRTGNTAREMVGHETATVERRTRWRSTTAHGRACCTGGAPGRLAPGGLI